MRRKKYILLALLFLFIQVNFISSVKAQGEAFTIEHFNVEFKINESGEIVVDQQLNVNFSERKHGIYLNIPTLYEMKWEIDGQTVNKKYRFPVSNIVVIDRKYSVESYGEGKRIVIGDPEKYVIGAEAYNAKYTVKTTDLGLNGKQSLYYAIVAPNWDTTIESVSFVVHMPKTFDINTINFYFGEYGSEANTMQGFSYQVVDSTIYGNLSTTLLPKEGITIKLDLPYGYFSYPKPIEYTNFILVFTILLTIASIFVFYKFGKDDVVIKTIEFKAPAGLTCASISYVMDGHVSTTDVLSLIIEWAYLEYLSIEEIDSDNLRMTKLKDMDVERYRYEKRMFQALFETGDVVETKTLQESFYTHIQTVSRDIKQYYSHKERRVFTKSSMVMQGFSMFVAIVPTFLAMLDSLNKVFYDFTPALVISMIFALFGLLVIALWENTISKRLTKSRGKVIGAMFGATMLSILYFGLFTIVIIIGTKSQLVSAVAIGSTIVISICAFFMDKRTDQGLTWYGQVLGLKDFILTAEKSRLEMLVKDNPQYFYYILPYAYVLGVSDVWSKKFTDIIMDSAKWYKSDSAVPVIMFMPRYYRSMSTLQQLNTMPPVKMSTGGGKFTSGGSGGGFSGGGFGGGGGGSW